MMTNVLSSLSCRFSRASCSPFERFEYFGGFICAISLLILLFVAPINISIVWCSFLGIHVLSVVFQIYLLVFGLVVSCLVLKKFNYLIKTIYFVKKIHFVEILLHWFKSLNISLLKVFVIQLIRFLAGSS